MFEFRFQMQTDWLSYILLLLANTDRLVKNFISVDFSYLYLWSVWSTSVREKNNSSPIAFGMIDLQPKYLI